MASEMQFPVGIKVIKEMTREELIQEIEINQRAQLEAMELKYLRANVVNFRIAEATKRIKAEAGLRIEDGVFGQSVSDEDEE